MNKDVVLKMNHITKAFPGVVALDDVSFDLRKGEIHALCGENGAGKSTLIKILGGSYIPDEGSIEINQKLVRLNSPQDSLDNRIVVIYQEFNLVPDMSIAENLFLGKEIVHKRLKNLNKREMVLQSEKILSKLGVTNVDCTMMVRKLSVALQQLIEIGKALFIQSDILVMDEPTAVLTDHETHELFKLMNNLKGKGVSIIYISHRLEEVTELSDRITILRDGKYIDTLDNSKRDVSKDEIVKHMVGRDLDDYYPERVVSPSKDNIFEVRGITKRGIFEDISFHVKKGEVLGFAGLVGAGRTDIMKALFGMMAIDSGEILLDNNKVEISSPYRAKQLGIGFVPEDRKSEGIVLSMDLGENICLPNHDKIQHLGYIVKEKKHSLINRFLSKLSVRPPLPYRLIRNFSGGNQQKAVIAKWLAINPKLIILDEPTRGIDVGAKAEIYTVINKLAEEGLGVIVVSSELNELLGMCDRILAIHEGKIAGKFIREHYNQANIMEAVTGLNKTS